MADTKLIFFMIKDPQPTCLQPMTGSDGKSNGQDAGAEWSLEIELMRVSYTMVPGIVLPGTKYSSTEYWEYRTTNHALHQAPGTCTNYQVLEYLYCIMDLSILQQCLI